MQHPAAGERVAGFLGGRHRFLEATGTAEQHRAVEVDQRRPQPIAFPLEDAPRLAQRRQRAVRAAAAAGGERRVGERLGRLVGQLELGEKLVGAAGEPRRIGGEVELEVDLRKVEIAQRLVIAVAGPDARLARRLVAGDRDGVFAAQEIEIGDVVVGLDHQTLEPFGEAEGAALPVDLERLLEVVQADVARRDVAQADRRVLGSPERDELAVGGAVALERLGPAVLAGQYVGQVVVENGEAQPVAPPFEDLPRLGFEPVDPPQLAEIGEVGQRARAGDRPAQLVARGGEKAERAVVELLRLLAAAGEMEGVGGGAGGEGLERRLAQLGGEETGGAGQLDRPLARDADLAADLGADRFEPARGAQIRPPGEEFAPLPLAHQVGQLAEDLVVGEAGSRALRNQVRPAASSAACSFLRQRPRMKPIEPVARPSRSATSL
jgi:hypothetical protein